MPRDPNRFLQLIEAPGALESYLLFRVDGREMLSSPFEFRLVVRAHDQIPPAKAWIGASITFVMGASEADHNRKINGVCSRFEHAYQKGRYVEFVIDVTPAFVSTRLRRDSRIFANKTAKDIIAELLREHNIPFDDTKVKHVADVREYCVQHLESDFDFLNRLMEEEGIFYYFRYDEGAGRFRHKMYLTDDPSGYFDDPHLQKLSFRQDHLLRGVRSIEKAELHSTGAWITHDYNYKKPKDLRPITTPTRLGWGQPGTHHYDWPGGYETAAQGRRLSKIAMEESEATNSVLEGTGSYLAFVPGARFEIDDQRLMPKERRIAIRSVIHSAWDPYALDEGGEPTYTQQFTAVPSYEPYRPPCVTPPALVRGPQTAVVLDQDDPEGLGRIKVRFHWDRHGASSCWVRVAQQWAGRSFGAQFIPRIGMEVLVDFVDGEADRPVVVGCLYNGDNDKPYPLSQSGWRTTSHPGGGVLQEFVFEDKQGEEEIYTFAGRNYRRKVSKDEIVDIDETLKKHVGKDADYTYDQKLTTHVKQNAELRVDQSVSATITQGIEINGMMDGTWTTTGGLTIESKTRLVLKVAGSSIELTPAGIAITGPLVRINS